MNARELIDILSRLDPEEEVWKEDKRFGPVSFSGLSKKPDPRSGMSEDGSPTEVWVLS